MSEDNNGNLGGRPTIFTQEIAEEICVRIAGGESLHSICRDEHLPHRSTVLLWVVNDREGFFYQYALAREAAGYAHADNVVEVAEMARREEINPKCASPAIQGYQWAAERMAPKKHSPKQIVDNTSSDGSMTPPQRIEIVPGKFDDEETDGQD